MVSKFKTNLAGEVFNTGQWKFMSKTYCLCLLDCSIYDWAIESSGKKLIKICTLKLWNLHI